MKKKVSSVAMGPTIPSELNKFHSHTNRLKVIFNETMKCFNDINQTGKFDGTQVVAAELLKEEELEITSVIHNAPAIIIFGQSPYIKSRLINELFGKCVFPVLDEKSEVKLRMVKIMHGNTNTVCLTLPDDFDLVDNLEAYNGPWNTIPLADLEIVDNPDHAKDVAVMEVTQNHPLLRFGAQIIVTPSSDETEDGFAAMVTKVTKKVTPILVYGFTSEYLEDKDIVEITQISKVTNYEPIFFVRVPPPGSRTVDTDPPDGAPPPIDPSSSSVNVPPSAVLPHHPHPPPHHHNLSDYEDIPHQHRNNPHGWDGGYVSPPPHSLAHHHPHHHHNHHSPSRNKRHPHHPHHPSSSYTDSETARSSSNNNNNNKDSPHRSLAYEQLKRLGHLEQDTSARKFLNNYADVESVYVEKFTNYTAKLAQFLRKILQSYLVNASRVLNITHTRCLNMFILSAFDMARDMLITPKKLEFAKEKEDELYKSLLKIAVSKIDEIKNLISETIAMIGSCLIAEAGEFEFLGIDLDRQGNVSSMKEVKACTEQIREMVLSRLNHAVAGKLVSSVDILRDSYTGTLTRCLESLEELDKDNPEGSKTTDALKQILNAAYTVEITVRSSSTFINNLLEKMKQGFELTFGFLHTVQDLLNPAAYSFVRTLHLLVQSMPWKSTPTVDVAWKKKVATDMLSSLSEARLARSISSQIKDRLNKSHEAFASALRHLESRHSGRLDKIEEHRLKLRKVNAPRLAKLALESTSLCDVLLHNTPQIGREIGRGQYGVVYSCDAWGKYAPCAIKSVVPPDDKHWNDLALEFFYTKNIPEHARIVSLRGSVIDYLYGGGTSPAVLLVMERLQRDLYTAIKQGLDWVSRLQVSIDVVEGLRYLHSQGLVHRDVKLKNVLLDTENRGKITDLGFCKPEAMMSGSIVGTPIHMAPELFTGQYDNNVDVYAFGILFWYVCAGHVRLPNAFEQCANKDQLWQSVKKGLRPEQPLNTSEDCWVLMQSCWEGEPSRRPFFGDVEACLKVILDKYKRKAAHASDRKSGGSHDKKGRSSGSSSHQHSSPRHSKQISHHR